MKAKLVLLLEGQFVSEDGKSYYDNTPSIINEAYFFEDNKKYQ